MNNKRKHKRIDYEVLKHEKEYYKALEYEREIAREELRRLREDLYMLKISRLPVLHDESDNDDDSLFRKAYNDFMEERGDIC